jgi:hypothetical protein
MQSFSSLSRSARYANHAAIDYPNPTERLIAELSCERLHWTRLHSPIPNINDAYESCAAPRALPETKDR